MKAIACCTVLGLSLASVGMAWAQDTRLADQALHCSAVLELLAQAHADDAPQAQRLQRAVSTFTEVHRQALGGSGAIAQELLLQRRHQAVTQVRASLPDRAAHFREDVVVCGAWAEGFLAQGEPYQYLVVYPKVVAPHIRQRYQTLADQAVQQGLR